jgi:hypothetical protein
LRASGWGRLRGPGILKRSRRVRHGLGEVLSDLEETQKCLKAGKYKASAGVNTACDNCPAGTFSPSTGVLCTQCPAGKTSQSGSDVHLRLRPLHA